MLRQQTRPSAMSGWQQAHPCSYSMSLWRIESVAVVYGIVHSLSIIHPSEREKRDERRRDQFGDTAI